MTKTDIAKDVGGRDLCKGDTVATLGDNVSARICDLAEESDMEFVCLRPLHQPYGKGVWHPADQVQLIARSKR